MSEEREGEIERKTERQTERQPDNKRESVIKEKKTDRQNNKETEVHVHVCKCMEKMKDDLPIGVISTRWYIHHHKFIIYHFHQIFKFTGNLSILIIIRVHNTFTVF